MNKADLRILERIFEDDVQAAIWNTTRHLPAQLATGQDRRAEELERQGYVRRVEVTLPGRLPVVVKGWQLTALGHMTYCMSRDSDVQREGD